MNEILPIGTVIKLKNIEKPYMIISLKTKNLEGKDFLYAAVPFPLGYLGIVNKKCFNNSEIEEIYFLGYLNNESRKYLKSLKGC